ncbi:uncharacterized protein LOC110685178 isoform X2 [Chenopodium quinoa]|uniref:uncharacterized protein LOC110685178 isoform X2 n=1 Tax=Chenopodium quinoa TaxID=63459 RepID=UPI000B79A01D|nr:uncharacterized protein LOC110685178 isoform X2 [Chenopodium quinoa]
MGWTLNYRTLLGIYLHGGLWREWHQLQKFLLPKMCVELIYQSALIMPGIMLIILTKSTVLLESSNFWAFQASPRRLMTANVYTALLAASINATSTEDGLNLYDSGHRFEHVQLLLVLLRSLPYASTALQCRVLQDLLFLACSHPDNRSFLTQMEEWPEWLLEVLISIYERTSVKSLNSSSLGDVEDLIHSFMIIMLEHSMRQKDGWKDIEATIHKICLLNSAAATYFSNCLLISAVATYFSNCLLISATAAYFSRSVFFKILSNLFQHQSYFFKDFDSSIGHLISVTYFSIGLLQDFDSSSSSLFQHRSSSRF